MEMHVKKKIKKAKTNRKSWPNQQKTIVYANQTIEKTINKLGNPSIVLSSKYTDNKGRRHFNIRREKWGFFKHLFHEFKDVFTLILIAIAIYNFVMFTIDPADFSYLAGGLLVTFLVSASTAFQLANSYSIYKNNKVIKTKQNDKIKTLRNQPQILSIDDLLSNLDELKDEISKTALSRIYRGDIVYFAQGDIVPVDCKIISSKDLLVSQEVLSGDNKLVWKKAENDLENKTLNTVDNILYAGSEIKKGEGWAVVLFTGSKTLFEHKKQVEVDQKPDTSFNLQIGKVTKILITTIIVFVPTIFIMSGILEGWTAGFDNPKIWVHSLIFSMAIAVALAPDALPLILASSFGRVRTKLSKNNIVSRDGMVAQNIGSMDVLTIDFESIFVKSEARLASITNLKMEEDYVAFGKAIIALENHFVADEKMLSVLRQADNYEKIKKEVNKKFKFLYTHENRLQNIKTTIVKDNEGRKYSIIVGSKNDILDKTTTFRINDINETITATKREEFHSLCDASLSKGIESIAVAIKELPNETNKVILSNNYTFLGMINYTIKTRSKSKDVIKEIRDEKVHIKFFTRSSLDTAIATTSVLKYSIRETMSSEEVMSMSPKELSKVLPKVNLFYNMDSMSEVKVIKALQKMGSTVGFLGKDIEDANQLLAADIGITTNSSDSFGKVCANMLIRDADMLAIALAIRESRKALMNVMKFIKFKISGAISLTLKLIIGLFILNHEPMSAIQLLVQNLLFDIVQFSIIYDSLDDRYIEEPIKWDTKSIIPFALWNGIIIQLIMVINILVINFLTHPGIISDIRNQVDGWETKLVEFQAMYWLEDTVSNMVFGLVMANHYKPWFKELPAKPTFISIVVVTIIALILPWIPGTEIIFDLAHSNWQWTLFIIGMWAAFLFVFDGWKEIYVRIKKKWL